MIITYHGHSSFKLKGKDGSVVTDPFSSQVGFDFPKVTADIVTVSHDHGNRNQVGKVGKTARRDKPFIISAPGEYEVGGISVFGVKTSRDQTDKVNCETREGALEQGEERGDNTIFTILLDDLRICHLGDLSHELTPEQITKIGSVDLLLCPVGGVLTIDPKVAVKTIKALEPSIVIPMHYQTPGHDEKVFGEMSTLEEFLKEYGVEVEAEEKLNIDKSRLPEETEVVVLRRG